MADIEKVEHLAREAERLQRKLARMEVLALMRLLSDVPTEFAEAAIRDGLKKYQAAAAVAHLLEDDSLNISEQVAQYMRDA